MAANSLPPTICGKPKHSRQAFSVYHGRLRENSMHEIVLILSIYFLSFHPVLGLKYWLFNNEHTSSVKNASLANDWWYHFVAVVAVVIRRFSQSASSCFSVRLASCNNKASTGGVFMKFDIWVFHENLSRKFNFSLKSDTNGGYVFLEWCFRQKC